MSRLVAVADNRYQGRMIENQEFEWLLSDIEDYNQHTNEKSVSLLESVGRDKMKEEEEKKAARKAQREVGGPLLEEDSVLADSVNPDLGEYPDMAEDESDESENGEEGRRPRPPAEGSSAYRRGHVRTGIGHGAAGTAIRPIERKDARGLLICAPTTKKPARTPAFFVASAGSNLC